MLASFDLGSDGAITNQSITLDHEPKSSTAWRIVYEDGKVSVFARVDGKATRIAGARAVRHQLKKRRALREHVVAWGLIATALGEAIDRAPLDVTGDVELVEELGMEPRAKPPARRVKVKPAIAIAIFGGFIGFYGFRLVTIGTGVLSIPLVAGGLVGGWLLSRGLSILSSPEALNEPDERDSDGKKQPGPIARGGLLRTTFGGLLFGAIMLVLGAMKRSEPPEPAPTPPSTSAPAVSPPVKLETRVSGAQDFATALALASGAFTSDGDANARLLAHYPRLTWSELQGAGSETTIALALKDAERERGNRVCGNGTVVDIEREDLAGRPIYRGALTTADGDTLQFLAVGSTGTLVKRSPATFCGIVTGRRDKALLAVILFDLPENQRPAVER